MFLGRVGKVRRGPHSEMYVQVEQDETKYGWHIWLMAAHPAQGPSDGWDIWADTWDQVLEWLDRENLDVQWLPLD